MELSFSGRPDQVAHEAALLAHLWTNAPRWKNVRRNYDPESVLRLRNSFPISYTIADRGARRLWDLLHTEEYVHALGALTGNQAMQQVRAGLKAIYLSGWQVAADANLSGKMYPDQSLYPANSVPDVVRKINQTLLRADQIEHAEGNVTREWMAPIVADAEAGFGGSLNAYELMRAMIESGASGVHFEDQLASEKKCGHLGGKVLVPTSQFIDTLSAARLAADVMGVPTVLIARTDADSATLITSDIDERDHPFIDRDRRTPEGFFHLREVSNRPSREAWRIHRIQISSGAKPAILTSEKPGSSLKRYTVSIQIKCSPIIAPRRLIGKRIWMLLQSHISRGNWVLWDIGFNL